MTNPTHETLSSITRTHLYTHMHMHVVEYIYIPEQCMANTCIMRIIDQNKKEQQQQRQHKKRSSDCIHMYLLCQGDEHRQHSLEVTQHLVAAGGEEGVRRGGLNSVADVFIPTCPLWSASAVRANVCEFA